MTQESTIQRNIRLAMVEEFGGFWRKIHTGPFQDAGFPDLIGCVRGRYIALEVKRPGKEASPIQKRTHQLIRENGGTAEVVTSVEDACRVVRKALRIPTHRA